MAIHERFELFEGRGLVGKHVPPCVCIVGDLDASIMATIRDPLRGEVTCLGELRHGEIPGNGTWMRLAPFLKHGVCSAEGCDGPG